MIYLNNSLIKTFVIISQLIIGALISEVVPSLLQKALNLQRSVTGGDVVEVGPPKDSEDNATQTVIGGSGTGDLLGIPLGSTSTTPYPVKLGPEDEDRVEEDCTESMFMAPFHYPVNFSANMSISKRVDPECKWNFFGTEPCIPMLSCPSFHLKSANDDGNCTEEYLEVFDGNTGIKRYCGRKGPVNISAAEEVRDLYIKFKTKRNKKDKRENIFTCTVTCSQRGIGEMLPMDFVPKVNPRCICGNKPNDDRIVNGENATKGEFPWLAALVETNTRQPFCGGSIMNDRIILTAGHCIKGKFLNYKNFEIILNGHVLDISPNLNQIRDKPKPLTYDRQTLADLDSRNGSVRLKVEEIMVHPLYVAEFVRTLSDKHFKTNDFDVALIRLKTPIDFSKHHYLNPVCLPTLGSYLRTFALKKATIAGWGLPDATANGTVSNLQKLSVNVYNHKDCKELYAHRVNRRMLCAGYVEGGRDSCAGDSGGPLVTEDRKKVWYQIGSVSWGESCALPGNPGVYFRTTESGQWIHYNSNINDAMWCAVP